MKVLIADDSDLILDWLSEMLSAFIQVEIVARVKNGNEALTALLDLKPDLAIVDLKMPGMSGLEVLKEIRKVNKDVKFMILTFYAFDPYRQSAIKAGADYFFSKSDDFENVKLVVKGILETEINDKVKYEITGEPEGISNTMISLLQNEVPGFNENCML